MRCSRSSYSVILSLLKSLCLYCIIRILSRTMQHNIIKNRKNEFKKKKKTKQNLCTLTMRTLNTNGKLEFDQKK